MTRSSERRGRPCFPRRRSVLGRLALVLAAASAAIGADEAGVLLSQQEALELAFPGAEVERRTAYLEEEQMDAARELAGGRIEMRSAAVPYYVAVRDGEPLGVAYFDTHRVRTEAATVMLVVDPAGRLERVEVVSFYEPSDYLPRQAWLDQFRDHPLDDRLALKRDIRAMTGATLTAESITEAARRVLALHAVIDPLDAGAGGEPRP
jgi:hypothetical protein